MNVLVTSLPDLYKINPQRPHHLLNYLSKRHHVTVICVHAWWLENIEDPFLEIFKKNVDLHYITNRPLHPVLQETILINNLDHIISKTQFNTFDVHINFNSLLAGYITAKKLDAPFIFDICDDVIDWIISSKRLPSFAQPITKIIGYDLLKRNINLSNQITYSTDYLKLSYNLPGQKSNFIPNGVDIDMFSNSNNDVRENIGVSQKEFIIGFVGFLGDWVDLHPLINAIKQLKLKINIKLLIVGSGTRFEYLKKFVLENNIQDNIMFTGNIPYGEVVNYISIMDICVLPFDASMVSKSASPLKLFEYMACGKPVICSPLPGIRNSVGDLVFYVTNEQEWAEMILELYYNEELRIQLGKNGMNFVREKYSWNNICNKFETVLIKAIEGT